MGPRRRLIASAIVVALGATAATACKRKVEDKKTADPPRDHLAPGEVVEGTERAFGLPLPRASRVAARFAASVHVTSTVTPEQLANFVRARVKDGTVTQGTTSTRLENVIPRDDQAKRLTIEVRPVRAGNGDRSELFVRDATPPPFDPTLSVEQRWQKAGITPEGKLLDPQHLE